MKKTVDAMEQFPHENGSHQHINKHMSKHHHETASNEIFAKEDQASFSEVAIKKTGLLKTPYFSSLPACGESFGDSGESHFKMAKE